MAQGRAETGRVLAELKAEIRRWRRWTITTLVVLYGVVLPLYMWVLAPIFGLR